MAHVTTNSNYQYTSLAVTNFLEKAAKECDFEELVEESFGLEKAAMINRITPFSYVIRNTKTALWPFFNIKTKWLFFVIDNKESKALYLLNEILDINEGNRPQNETDALRRVLHTIAILPIILKIQGRDKNTNRSGILKAKMISNLTTLLKDLRLSNEKGEICPKLITIIKVLLNRIQKETPYVLRDAFVPIPKGPYGSSDCDVSVSDFDRIADAYSSFS